MDTHRGISASMGAEKMSAVCLELQKAGETGSLSRAPALVGQLEEEFGRVRPALKAEAEKAEKRGVRMKVEAAETVQQVRVLVRTLEGFREDSWVPLSSTAI